MSAARDEVRPAESPAAPPQHALRRNWVARTRLSTAQTQRYSRFVVNAKRGLAIAAALLVALVLLYSFQPRDRNSKRLAMSFQSLGVLDNDLAMIKPRLTGVTDEGDPYIVTAAKAIQDHLNAKRARLIDVQGDVTLKDGTWLTGTAPRGFLDASEQTLVLFGPIAVYSDTGYEVHSNRADINMANGMVTGNVPATGQGPLGTFRADRYRIDRDRNLVFLYGNVRMVVYGHMRHT